MSSESKKKRVQFRAPRGLVDRADALAAVFETDRTDILISALVRNDAISPDAADEFLAEMSDARSWSSNSYVERAQSTLRQQRDNEQPDPN